MCPWHGCHIDMLAILVMVKATVALVVPEAVFDADDDPTECKHDTPGLMRLQTREVYHKLVKTTPKPRATKNRSGELVGPELLDWLPLPVGVGEAGSAAEVGEDMAAEEGMDEVV